MYSSNSRRRKSIQQKNNLNPIVRVILQGVYDDESLFSLLRGTPHILNTIWKHITFYWKQHIITPTYNSAGRCELGLLPISERLPPWRYFSFPESRDLKINMMPFVMGETFGKCFLPQYLWPYWFELIKPCLSITRQKGEIGKIGYLTIQEYFPGKLFKSQRRPGLHIESHGVYPPENVTDDASFSNTRNEGESSLRKGGGKTTMVMARRYPHLYDCPKYDTIGGMYISTNAPIQLRNCQILPDYNGEEIIGKFGDIEHLREFLPKPENMYKGGIYWISDRTPIESLPLQEQYYTQFFRLVTSDVSVWYKDQSTTNPYGIIPDPKITKTVMGPTFKKNGAAIAEIEVMNNAPMEWPPPAKQLHKKLWKRLRKVSLRGQSGSHV